MDHFFLLNTMIWSKLLLKLHYLLLIYELLVYYYTLWNYSIRNTYFLLPIRIQNVKFIIFFFNNTFYFYFFFYCIIFDLYKLQRQTTVNILNCQYLELFDISSVGILIRRQSIFLLSTLRTTTLINNLQ
jgi:hypothetical protein